MKRTCDQKLSSGLLLNLKPAQLFQFRFTPTEQSRLEVAQGSGSGVVSWFDASSINGHGLLEEDPVTPKIQVRNEIVLAGPEWCFLRYKHGAALFALGNLDFSCLLYPPVSCSLSSCRLKCTRKLDCFPWLDSGHLSVSSRRHLGTMKLHQTLPLHGAAVPVNASANGIHAIEHHQSAARPSVEFRTCSVDGTRDAVPVIRGSSLQGESVVARQHTGSTSWFVWLKNMVLILRSTGPYSFMAKSSRASVASRSNSVVRNFLSQWTSNKCLRHLPSTLTEQRNFEDAFLSIPIVHARYIVTQARVSQASGCSMVYHPFEVEG